MLARFDQVSYRKKEKNRIYTANPHVILLVHVGPLTWWHLGVLQASDTLHTLLYYLRHT